MTRTYNDQQSNTDWLKALRDLVAHRSLIIFRFTDDEWENLRNSRRGINEFTIARSYSLLDNIRVPTACLLIGKEFAGKTEVYCGLLKSRSAVTTLDSRLKLTSTDRISPSSERDLLHLVTDNSLKSILRARLKLEKSVIRLSPELSVHLVEKLAARAENRRAMRTVIASLDAPKTYSGNNALQEDAVSLALKAFGLSPSEPAVRVDTADDKETTLARVNILEDAVIEHDARVVPGFALSDSELTGRAIFRKGGDLLEIITANKRPLEEVLGVDLIYLNAIKQNVVMLQYKMLDPDRNDRQTDWIYRPNSQLHKEITRMKRFSRSHPPGPLEYRINPQVFYLRFVRRDATLGKSTVTMPIDHFELLRNHPNCKGPKGAFRISYDTLDGRYLRQEGFLDLVHSGYIGAYAKDTTDLETLIRAILREDRAVVAAVHSSFRNETLVS